MSENSAPEREIRFSKETCDSFVQLMIDEFARRLSRPGLDGAWYRHFILDWLFFDRPMFDRFRGAEFNIQFEGPPVEIDGLHYPLGGFIERQIEWTRISPADAFDLREKLRKAVDETIHAWMAGRDFDFVPAHPEKSFTDRAAADAAVIDEIRAFAGALPEIGEFG